MIQVIDKYISIKYNIEELKHEIAEVNNKKNTDRLVLSEALNKGNIKLLNVYDMAANKDEEKREKAESSLNNNLQYLEEVKYEYSEYLNNATQEELNEVVSELVKKVNLLLAKIDELHNKKDSRRLALAPNGRKGFNDKQYNHEMRKLINYVRNYIEVIDDIKIRIKRNDVKKMVLV